MIPLLKINLLQAIYATRKQKSAIEAKKGVRNPYISRVSNSPTTIPTQSLLVA